MHFKTFNFLLFLHSKKLRVSLEPADTFFSLDCSIDIPLIFAYVFFKPPPLLPPCMKGRLVCYNRRRTICDSFSYPRPSRLCFLPSLFFASLPVTPNSFFPQRSLC